MSATHLEVILDVWLSLDGDEAGDEARRLVQWLREDTDLRPTTTIHVVDTPGKPGDMGPGSELIQVAFQQHGVLVALVGVLTTWIGTRRRNVTIRLLVREKEKEKEVLIKGAKLEDPTEVAARLLRELNDHG
jgi:hypothetical protein